MKKKKHTHLEPIEFRGCVPQISERLVLFEARKPKGSPKPVFGGVPPARDR